MAVPHSPNNNNDNTVRTYWNACATTESQKVNA